MKIIYSDEDIVVVEKGRGMFVHPPENKRIRIDPSQNGMAIVRDLLNQWVYPVHRLDVSTSGVMIYALSSASASKLAHQFETGKVKKTYEALVRGFVEPAGEINTPLKRDSNQSMAEATTQFRCLRRVELPIAGSRHPTTRISWVQASPLTGRYHQIRRHFHRISHPVIGDANHGDCKVNRGFAAYCGISGLLLRATQIAFNHPHTGLRVDFHAPENEIWSSLRANLDWQEAIEAKVPLLSPQEQIHLRAQSTGSYLR